MSFQSTNKLDFEQASPRDIQLMLDPNCANFKVGTVTGLYTFDEQNFIIVGITNHKRGNGHLTDVLEWFEQSCKRDGKNLKVVELWNKKFMQHLIEKRGFTALDKKNVIKYIKNEQ